MQERSIHGLPPLHSQKGDCAQTKDRTHNLGMWPLLGEAATLQLQDDTATNLATLAITKR